MKTILPVPVLAKPEPSLAVKDRIETDGEARESTQSRGGSLPSDSRGGQNLWREGGLICGLCVFAAAPFRP